MATKYLCLLLVAVVATSVSGQSEPELQIPVENDNQFPPEINSEPDGTFIEGSGFGIVEEPLGEPTTDVNVPIIEDIQQTRLGESELTPIANDDNTCPSPCVCHYENEEFVVDCSGYELTKLPDSINTKTTTLNIQNNKLTDIPREIASLKQLKILNAANNSIMDIAAGSISELSELMILKLGNNKLVEYPQDLKNGFGLTKLEELDLSGNDMRSILTPETFTSFKALKSLILPSSNDELAQKLCASLTETLEQVCTESCTTSSFECPDAPENVDDDMMNAVLPGIIPLLAGTDESDTTEDDLAESEKSETTPASVDTSNVGQVVPTELNDNNASLNEIASRSGIEKAANEDTKLGTIVAATNNQASDDHDDQKPGVEVGATTVDTKTGGVDKNIIGLIIAGMVVIVAGITIKKNWSSIKNKFSSSPRPANERNNGNANGVSPEEVPLQDKSPV